MSIKPLHYFDYTLEINIINVIKNIINFLEDKLICIDLYYVILFMYVKILRIGEELI